MQNGGVCTDTNTKYPYVVDLYVPTMHACERIWKLQLVFFRGLPHNEFEQWLASVVADRVPCLRK